MFKRVIRAKFQTGKNQKFQDKTLNSRSVFKERFTVIFYHFPGPNYL